MTFARTLLLLAFAASLAACPSSSNPVAVADAGEPMPPYLDGDCDPIAPSRCGLPFPSNVWMKPDTTSPTGLRVAFGAATLPMYGGSSVHMDPAFYADFDGFSPSQASFTHLPGATLTALPTLATLPESMTATSPTIVMEAATGTLIPHFVELDMSGKSPADEDKRVLMVRPVVRLKDATRYIVAIRHVVDKTGSPIAPSPAFQALRDGTESAEKSVATRRPLYADVFARLEKAGVPKSDLQIAWDYTTSSDDNLTSTLIAMRDDAFAKVGEAGPKYTITKTTDAPNPHIRRRIDGTFTVPHYLDKETPGGKLVRDASNKPVSTTTASFPFVVYVPNSVATMGPAPLLQNGHGLLQDHDQGGSLAAGDDYLSVLADTKNYVVFAVDWSGLAANDQSYIGGLLQGDMGKFKNVIDRTHQGIINALLAMRMMQGRFYKDPAVQVNGKSAIDPTQRFYRGDSQGGILGTTYAALSPDVARAHIGMAGMGYSAMLQRSADFTPFFAVLAISYPDVRDQQLVIALISMLWDRVEGTAFAPHVLAKPLPGVPAKQVLIHVAIGDYQVPAIAGHMLARTIGAKSVRTAPRSIFGIEEADSPFAGSGLVEWDFGVTDSPINAPSTGNPDLDPHGKVRTLLNSHTQTDTFFRTGKIDMTACKGGPCKPL